MYEKKISVLMMHIFLILFSDSIEFADNALAVLNLENNTKLELYNHFDYSTGLPVNGVQNVYIDADKWFVACEEGWKINIAEIIGNENLENLNIQERSSVLAARRASCKA